VGDFSAPLLSIDRWSRQKLNKDILELKNVINQIKLIDIYRTFHPNTKQYTFFFEHCGTFSKIDHILGHNRYRKLEIIPCIL
jgi:exonuclease III